MAGQWTGNMEGIREKMTGKFEHGVVSEVLRTFDSD